MTISTGNQVTTTLIVLAHPDRRSFNGAWADASAAAAQDLGHTVLFSDLYGMGFDPAERASHHPDWDAETSFDPLKAQEADAHSGNISEPILGEIDKIRQADQIIFHFPMWWFAPPAMLKGWFDRVLLHGALHTVDQRFDTGLCRGKRALFCVTTGSNANESAHNGKEGDVTMLLWPACYTLRYLGFTVLEPKVVHGVHGYHRDDRLTALQNRLKGVLAEHRDLIGSLPTRAEVPFNADSDFENGQLRPDRPSHSAFIRHRP